MENANKHKYNMLFSIANYNICEEQKFPFKRYVMYTILIKSNTKNWEIKRRYKHFDELHDKLVAKKISNLPKLPPKKLFMTKEGIQERRSKLLKYLETLLSRDDVYKIHEVLEFIAIEKEDYLMMKENLSDVSTRENSPCNSEKFKSFINLKKSRDSHVMINENFFYSKNFYLDDEECVTDIFNIENPMKTLILNFLKDLNSNIIEKCKIIKDFENQLVMKKSQRIFDREEVYRLLYGEKVEDKYFHGLLFHCGNIKENQIGAEYCLEYLSKLIDYQHNFDCDNFLSILKIAKLHTVLEMKLDQHMKSNKKKVISSSVNIIKILHNEEKGIGLKNILKSDMCIEKFQYLCNEKF
jgi:hypothetical protein